MLYNPFFFFSFFLLQVSKIWTVQGVFRLSLCTVGWLVDIYGLFRAAVRIMIRSSLIRGTGVPSAVQIMDTPACRCTTPAICTWSRSPMTRWAEREVLSSITMKWMVFSNLLLICNILHGGKNKSLHCSFRFVGSLIKENASLSFSMVRWSTASGWWRKNTASQPGSEDPKNPSQSNQHLFSGNARWNLIMVNCTVDCYQTNHRKIIIFQIMEIFAHRPIRGGPLGIRHTFQIGRKSESSDFKLSAHIYAVYCWLFQNQDEISELAEHSGRGPNLRWQLFYTVDHNHNSIHLSFIRMDTMWLVSPDKWL